MISINKWRQDLSGANERSYIVNILVGCEESQTVCKEFRKRGHNSYSNDIVDCSGGRPEWHLKMDVFDAINSRKWDMIIIHPPCTYLAVSGNRYYGKEKPLHYKRVESIEWTVKLWKKIIGVCNKVCMENPVGVLSQCKELPKPQYIQPWMFGHGETKKTGLWLYGLPKLIPTNIVEGREQRIWKMGPSKDRQRLRSITYQGIAEAMAEQWGKGE